MRRGRTSAITRFVAGATFAVALAGCSLIPRAGDPARLPDDDPRIADCGIPKAGMWMAFPIAHAREFAAHFDGWTQAPELLVDDPALVIIGNAIGGRAGGDELFYDMCIAVGPPDDALVHRYGPTRFEFVRPDLGAPPVPMP